jgi:FkbM family methyltransferase
MSKVDALKNLLKNSGPERDVSLRWLLHTGSRLDKRFARKAVYKLSPFGEFSQVDIEGQRFLWPTNAPQSALLQILSELFTADHPHQYRYGPTQIEANDIVLDIGASEGSFSALVTPLCKRVIAVEPSRSMHALIEKLFELRGQTCPTILRCLLGAKAGTAWFLETPDNPGGAHISDTSSDDAYEVSVRTLDEITSSMDEKPTFIKCDAEGAELSILTGGKEFLKSHRPKLAITTYHNDSDYQDLYKLLKDLGYNVMGKGFLFAHSVLRVQMLHAW